MGGGCPFTGLENHPGKTLTGWDKFFSIIKHSLYFYNSNTRKLTELYRGTHGKERTGFPFYPAAEGENKDLFEMVSPRTLDPPNKKGRAFKHLPFSFEYAAAGSQRFPAKASAYA